MRYILIILFFLVNCIPSEAQWVKINSLTATSVREVNFENGVFYAVAANGIWRSTDSGNSWTNISNGLSGDALISYSMLFDGPAIYIATVEGNFKTTNGGLNWEAKSSGIQIGPGATKRFCFSFLKDGNDLYSGAFSGLYKSTNGGDNWTLSGIPGPHSFVEAMTLYNGAIWAGRTSAVNPTLYRSTDSGSNWVVIPYFGSFTPEVFCFHETPDNKLFIGTGHGIHFTTNNGATWTERNNGLPPDPYNSDIVQYNNILFSSGKFGGNGVFRTTNEGLLWDDVGTSLPFLSDTYDLLIVDDTLYLGASNGIYKRPITEMLTNVITSGTGIPEKYNLHQNYPNPFNPSTAIDFDIPVSRFVSLSIYDISGRKIADLINENLNPGSYSYTFTAEGLTSGIYFYKLSTGEYTDVKKMLLIK